MAIISIAKLALFVTALVWLCLGKTSRVEAETLVRSKTIISVLAVLAVFAASLLWTVAPDTEAFGALTKYGKLLSIVLLLVLIKTRRDAVYALAAFAVAQIFLVTSSWMLFFELPVPWATSNMALKEKAVFSSYLDQGIMAAVFGALCWHLRSLAPGRWGPRIAIILGALSLTTAVFLLSGRSGHVVAIALVSAAIAWEIPKNSDPWRLRSRLCCLHFFL